MVHAPLYSRLFLPLKAMKVEDMHSHSVLAEYQEIKACHQYIDKLERIESLDLASSYVVVDWKIHAGPEYCVMSSDGFTATPPPLLLP
jgi:hypothetical protein